jgi:hypothetical protein
MAAEFGSQEAKKIRTFARSLLGFLASKFNFFDMLV